MSLRFALHNGRATAITQLKIQARSKHRGLNIYSPNASPIASYWCYSVFSGGFLYLPRNDCYSRRDAEPVSGMASSPVGSSPFHKHTHVYIYIYIIV